MDALKALLEEIRAGRTTFEPASHDHTDMLEFQSKAKLLAYANEKGYLESYLPHKESRTKHGWYDLVVVLNGLRHEGEMFLANPVSDASESKRDEIILLKPNVNGIGVDLKALWRKLRGKK